MDITTKRPMYPTALIHLILPILSLVQCQTNQYGQEGGSIRLPCPLSPPDKNGMTSWRGPPSLITYFINENKNPNMARGYRLSVVRNLNTGGYDLQITGLTRGEDVGEYNCNVNTVPPKEHTVHLDLYLMPQTPLIPRLRAVKENQQLTMNCSSSGNRPAANLSWRFRGSSIPATTTPPSVLDTVTQTYTVRSTLTVTLNRGDNGRNVACIASNIALSAGTQTVQTVFLHCTYRLYYHLSKLNKRLMAWVIPPIITGVLFFRRLSLPRGL